MRRYVTGIVGSTVPLGALLGALLGAVGISAQDLPDFHPGVQGEIYFAPRLDLIPADQGGPVEIELDGILDEPFWDKAAWHGMTHELNTPLRDDEDDASMIFAAATDGEFLYVAWQFTDDVLVINETSLCDVWRDDSVKFYIDANNDGPECFDGNANCYGLDG